MGRPKGLGVCHEVNKESGILSRREQRVWDFVMMRTESVSCYHEENRLFVCFVFTTRTECACFCHEETKECGFMSWGVQSVGLCHEETRECGFLSSGKHVVWVSVMMRPESVGLS